MIPPTDLRPPPGGMEPPYDGVAELWWESEEALAAASATDPGRRAGAELLADEARFIDLPASPLWLAHEYPQVNPVPEPFVARPKSPLVKLHYPLRHPPSHVARGGPDVLADQSRPADPVDGPSTGHAALPAGAPLRVAAGGGAAGVAGNGSRALHRPRRGVDGPVGSAGQSRGRGRRGRAAREDEARFIDFARSTMWIGKEYVLIDRWY